MSQGGGRTALRVVYHSGSLVFSTSRNASMTMPVLFAPLHIIDCEGSNRRGRESFHFDARSSDARGLGHDIDGSVVRDRACHRDVGQGDGVAQRNEVRGPFGSHDTSEFSRSEHWAFLQPPFLVLVQQGDNVRSDNHAARGDGLTEDVCRFCRHINHTKSASIEMG